MSLANRAHRIESIPALSARAQQFAQLFGYAPPGGVATNLAGKHGTTIANDSDLDAARVGFHAAFLQQIGLDATPIDALYTEISSRHRVEEYKWLGDLPGFTEWTGDRKLSGVDAFSFRLANKKWSNGIRVNNDDWKDDNLGLLPVQVRGLAAQAKRHRWDMMVKLLLNGFDGAAYPDVGNGLGYDGAFFFSDSHATGDNKLALALDATNLAAAELLLASQTTYTGEPMYLRGTHIICGPKLEPVARKIITQEAIAGGESNPNRGRYELITSPLIRGTYDDYWFLADLSQPVKPLLFQMREEISTSAVTANNSVPRFINDELWFGAEARYNVGYLEHRLIVGSTVA
ncbi:MAG: Mu-like prophage major head subunit gpT family protein [Kofleriaceae bacterium]